MPASEALSGISSASGGPEGGTNNGNRDGETEWALGTASLGVCYLVCKERAEHRWNFTIAKLFFDWLQLWLLVVGPPQFAISSDQLWWRVLSFVNMRQFMTVRGETFFWACFYLLVASLLLMLVACAWLSYTFNYHKEGIPEFVYVIRLYCRTFLYVLDIMSLNILLIPLDCQTFGVPADMIGTNKEFGYKCWSMPQAIAQFVAIFAILIFITVGAVFCVGEGLELDFKTRNKFAMLHIGTEFKVFLTRMVFVLVTFMVYNAKWLSFSQCVLAAYLAHTMIFWQPHLVAWVNHVRAGAYTSVLWCSVLCVIAAFNLGWDASNPDADSKSRRAVTIAMAVTTAPMFGAGYFASYRRMCWFNKRLDIYRYPVQTHSLEDYKLEDTKTVEILARCCRVWVNKFDLDPHAVQLADVILKIGLVHMPKNPFMLVLYASFLMDVQDSYQSGYTQLLHAKRMEYGFLVRVAIFCCEQQHASAQRSTGGVTDADVANQIEFQKQYSVVVAAHRDALFQIKFFWHNLQHHKVQFNTLADSVKTMDHKIQLAESIYRPVLARYAGNVKIVRLYAKFLEHVRLDPWAAARWFAEGDRLEALEEDEKHHDALGAMQITDPVIRTAMLNAGPTGPSDSQFGRGVIIVNAQSVMQVTNQAAYEMLGYSKTELKGRNLSALLPPFVGDVHSGLVKNYLRTGQEVALNHTHSEVVLHKEKRLVQIKMTALRISGTGEDTMFMGIMEEVAPSAVEAKCWVAIDGTVLGVDQNFEDWFAYTPKEITGTKFIGLVAQGAEDLDQALTRARAMLSEAHRKSMMGGPDGGASVAGGGADPGHGNASLRTERILQDYLAKSSFHIGSGNHDEEFGFTQSKKEQTLLPPFAMRALSGKAKVESDTRAFEVWGVQMAHKFSLATDVDMKVINCGIGSVRFHTIILRRRTDSANVLPMSGITTPAVLDLSKRRASGVMAPAVLQEKGFLLGGSDGQMGSDNEVLFTTFAPKESDPEPLSPIRIGTTTTAVLATDKPKAEDDAQALMLVTNAQGQVLHCTSALAEKLGRLRSQAMANGANNAIELLLVEPFSQLHRGLLSSTIPMSIPPWSCRSGLSVLLQATSLHGRPKPLPFKLTIQRQQVQGSTVFALVAQPRTLQQALDERRLSLKVNHAGVITSVDSASGAMFDIKSEHLLGRRLADLVTIFRPADLPDHEDMNSEQSEAALQVLLSLSTKAFTQPGAAWRVGVIRVRGLGGLPPLLRRKPAADIPPVPAIMRLFVHNNPEDETKGWVQVELWRTDMVSSVICVDNDGYILPSEVPELEELHPPGLLTGQPMESLIDQHISTIMPVMAKRSMMDLFTPGALGLKTHVAAQALRTAPVKASNIKAPKGPRDDGLRVSVQHLLNRAHDGDGLDLQLCIQAVRRGTGAVAYQLVVRPAAVTAGRRNFVEWLLYGAKDHKLPGPRPSLRNMASVKQRAGADDAILAALQDDKPEDAATMRSKQPSFAHTRSPRALEGSEVGGEEPQHPDPNDDDANSDGDEAVAKSVKKVSAWLEAENGRSLENRPSENESNPDSPLKAPPSRVASVTSLMMQASVPVDQHQQEVLQELPAEAEAMHHEAENTVADGEFKRGNKLKKLTKVLTSTMCQKPCDDYYRKALLIAIFICVVQVGAFVTIVFLLDAQHSLVNDLSKIGRAGVRATDIAMWTRTINMIYAKMEVPTLRLVSNPNDLPYLMQLYKEALDEFTLLHQGVYLGFNKPRQLPDSYGLRGIWEEDTYNIHISAEIQFNQSLGNFTLMRIWEGSWKMGLWEAGNTLSEKAASFLQNAGAYNATLGGNLSAFANFPDLAWIIKNSPGTIFPAYLSTQDAYLQLVLENLNSINTIQLILLAVQGVVLCCILSTWTWVLLQRLGSRRYSMFYIFMAVPAGVVRTMANRRIEVDEDDAEENAEVDELAMKQGSGVPPPPPEQEPAPAAPTANRLRFKESVAPTAADAAEQGAAEGVAAEDQADDAAQARSMVQRIKSFASSVSVWRLEKPPSVLANPNKKKLHPSQKTSVKLLTPIVLWGILVIITNGVGHVLLSAVAGPCALFNIVNYVMLLYNRNNFWLQELTYEPDFTKMNMHRQDSYDYVLQLKKEYNVMVYGHQAAPNETSFHYTSITTGVSHAGAQGNSILFGAGQCLCLNATECQPPDSHLYPYTTKGLDRMMLKYLEIGEYIRKFQYLDPYLNGPEYDFYWNTVPDMKGGFSRLADAYEQFVATNTQYVMILHVVALTITLACVGLYVLTCLRPFVKSTRSEARRIAELLSQLPAELDVNGILDRTLFLDMGVVPPPQQQQQLQGNTNSKGISKKKKA